MATESTYGYIVTIRQTPSGPQIRAQDLRSGEVTIFRSWQDFSAHAETAHAGSHLR